MDGFFLAFSLLKMGYIDWFEQLKKLNLLISFTIMYLCQSIVLNCLNTDQFNHDVLEFLPSSYQNFSNIFSIQYYSFKNYCLAIDAFHFYQNFKYLSKLLTASLPIAVPEPARRPCPAHPRGGPLHAGVERSHYRAGGGAGPGEEGQRGGSRKKKSNAYSLDKNEGFMMK